MTDYIPKSRQFRGSNASGNDGETGRTITLESTSILDGMVIRVNGTSLHYGVGADFQFLSGVVTFNNVIYNTDYIDISYFYFISSLSTTVTGYCNTEDIFDYLGLSLEVPNYDNGVTDKEFIGAADNTTTTIYFLDHNKVINGTQTIFYGSGSTATTYLTETTHYIFNNERGSFVLNDDGNALVGTENLYATYKYNVNYKDSVVQDLIDKNTLLIDGILNKSWQQEIISVREEQSGRGNYNRLYKTRKAPVTFAITKLSGDVDSSTTTFIVDSTTNYSTGDYCTIEDEVVVISSVDSNIQLTVGRAQLGTSAVAHSDQKYMINVVVEISNTREGAHPVWYLQGFRNQFDVDSEIGAVQLLHINARETDNSVFFDQYPSLRIFNRVRITYKNGSSYIPSDIKQLCILMSAKDLFNSQILSALARGTNGFNTDTVGIIDKEIDRIIKENYRIRLDGW
jgi:hypothetical protein